MLRNVVKNSNHWVTLKLLGGRSPVMRLAPRYLSRQEARAARRTSSAAELCIEFRPTLHSAWSGNESGPVEIHWLAVQKKDHDSAVDRIYTVKEAKNRSRRKRWPKPILDIAAIGT